MQGTLAERRDRVESLTLAGDLNGAADAAFELAALAERAGHQGMLNQAGRALERIGRYGPAYEIVAKVAWRRANAQRPDWDGSHVTSGTLLIEHRFDHIGSVFRFARLIALAAARAERCLVLIEPRMVTLLQRSFPGVSVRASSAEDDALRAEAEATASLQSLCALFATGEDAIRQSFVPLRPDRDRSLDLRRRYRSAPERPLVGLFWRSLNEDKDMPPNLFWAELIRTTSADFISLQYGDVEADLAEQRGLAGRAAFHDPTIDQMTDIDGFAAQIAALDAIVTISGTAAHVAGALGVPCIVVRDDKPILAWPVAGARSPWYPATIIIRKQGRDWVEVLDDVKGTLTAVLKNEAGLPSVRDSNP